MLASLLLLRADPARRGLIGDVPVFDDRWRLACCLPQVAAASTIAGTMPALRLADAMADVDLLPVREAYALAAAGMATVGEVLAWLPKRYEDRRRFDAFPVQPSARPVCLRGSVVDTSRRHLGRGKAFYEAVVMDGTGGIFGSGKITCRWFNMPFLHKVLAAGQDVILYGKPKDSGGRLVIDHPEFEVLKDEGGPSIHLERIVPIYRNIQGIAQRRLREIQHLLLENLDPAGAAADFDVDPTYPRHEAWQEVHFPDSLEQAAAARRRFALEEFFALQLNIAWRRARHQERQGRILGTKTTLLKALHASLPFELTDAQKRSVREIVADMRSPRPMHRLLQGDVGSGKTLVAVCAMLLAVDSGVQAALMAPTQILAEQHFLTLSKLLEPLGVRVALRTGTREDSTHLALAGQPQVIVGTHALLFDGTSFQDLGLVVIDEQHKFGVAQRAALVDKGVCPDVLVMTATPIPRTLTMTIYGDLDVSILDERPAGRGKVITAVRSAPRQVDVTKFVRGKLDEGRQAYLVYPLVEESETLRAESATEAHEKWVKRLPGHATGLLHGKLAAHEKERVMGEFRDGKLAALVATTVIEVGVDVPNASLMIIHHAERFGLSQLHQLRGRIGRGSHTSHCILVTDGKNPEAMEKLRVMEETSDGFKVAEADLRLRGPGDVLGTAQSGLSNLKFVDFLADTALVREARALADRVLAEDSSLSGCHRNLAGLILGEADQIPSARA